MVKAIDFGYTKALYSSVCHTRIRHLWVATMLFNLTQNQTCRIGHIQFDIAIYTQLRVSQLCVHNFIQNIEQKIFDKLYPLHSTDMSIAGMFMMKTC